MSDRTSDFILTYLEANEQPEQELVEPARSESVPLVASQDVIEALGREETGDAELLADLYAERIAYDHGEHQWYMWSGHHWEADTTNFVVRLVSDQLAAQYLNIAANLTQTGGNQDEINALIQRARALHKKHRIRNVLELAQSQPVGIDGSQWDKTPMLLGCKNVVLNLKTGKVQTGRPTDHMRTVCPTTWIRLGCPAKRWEAFLLEIFSLDVELIEFVQRLLGYGLTGMATEHVLPVLWGPGRNGKDTLLEALKYTLGELADPVDPGVLVETGHDLRSASPHKYSMRRKRLVWVNETNEGARLNAGQVKNLTGGGTITARPLYGKPVTFTPQYLPMLVTNHRPHANAEDYALWKRILLIPFTQAFVDDPNPSKPNEHPRDPNLLGKLKEEASGILAWLVRGCLQWQAHGLRPPDSIRVATAEYREQEDVIGQFLDERCTLTATAQTKASTLYRAYKEWADEYGLGRPMSVTAFGQRMTIRFAKDKTRAGVVYQGVGLLPDFPRDQAWRA